MMIAGRPGAMKSTLAMWWAAQLNIPTLYFSADMAPHTASTRLAACISGDKVIEVSATLAGARQHYYEDVLGQTKISLCFDSSPTFDDIGTEINAYVETWDAFPELIVVDNALNVDHGLEGHSGLLAVMDECHRMARVTGAAVWVLHHTTESTSTDPSEPQPSRDVQHKVTQLPEIVLTVAYDEYTGNFWIAPVKNRNGKDDPTGHIRFRLQAIPERALFRAPM